MILQANLDIDVVLSTIATGITYICGQIVVEPKEVKDKIKYLFMIMSGIVVGLNVRKLNYILFILNFLQKYWLLMCLFIIGLACLPSFQAKSDKKKCPAAVGDRYIKENLYCNLTGSLCPIALLFLLKGEVGDFRFLENFHIAGIVALFVPVCELIVFSYQYEEQKNKELDHSASLAWKNQVWNIFYLFNVILWSLVFAVFLVFYALYNYINSTYSQLTIWHLLAISLIFIFFYMVCGRSKYRYLYIIFLTDAPLILICSIYWMSLFIIDNRMLKYQMIFILFHLLCFTAIMFKSEGMVIKYKKNIEKTDANRIEDVDGNQDTDSTKKDNKRWNITENQNTEYKIKIPQLGIKIENRFYIFALALSVLIIFSGIYGNINYMPSTLSMKFRFLICLFLSIFYLICIFCKHRYLYFVFLTDTPLLLIVIIYQMSRFKIDDSILGWQTAFIFLNLLIYILIIYVKERIIALTDSSEKENSEYKVKIKHLGIKIKSWFHIFTIGVLLAALVILEIGPFSIERISFRYAQKCIDAICEDTGKDADELFDKIVQQDWSNGQKENIDSKKFHQYLYDNLKQELVDKEVISNEDTSLMADDLEKWFQDR